MSTVHYNVNCAFARVAIREYSEVGRGKGKCDTAVRMYKFKELFSSQPNYVQHNEIFHMYGHRESAFDRHCKAINGIIGRWANRERKQEYIECFSPVKWKQLSIQQQKRHSLANCKECAMVHLEQQERFPGPTYNPSAVLVEGIKKMVESNAALDNSVLTTTRQILGELQPIFKQAYGQSFTDSLVACPGINLQHQQTPSQRKRQKRKIVRECRDQINQQIQENDAVLAEGQSIESYKRMRLSQSFETPTEKYKRAQSTSSGTRKHSPNFENVNWDKEGLLNTLHNWPEGELINWTQVASEWNVPGSNRGQIVKEFAKENGIDVIKLDHRQPNSRLRARRLRLPGGEISTPVHKSVKGIKDEWNEMINTGKLSLGEPCFPHTLTKFSVHDGQLRQNDSVIYGRKIPLLELRNKLLQKHIKCMHLHTDEELNTLNKSDLLEYFHTHTTSIYHMISQRIP